MRGETAATATTTSRSILSLLFVIILITVLLLVVHLAALRPMSMTLSQIVTQSRLEDQQCHNTLDVLGVNQDTLTKLLQENLNIDMLDRLLLSDTLIQEAFEPLWCVPNLLRTLEHYCSDYDPTLYDLLRMSIMSMTVYNQKMHIYKSILKEDGFYLRTASEVRRRLDKYQKPFCNPDGGNNHTNSEQTLRVGICTMQHSNGPHIQEFVAHYLLMGVSKVYLLFQYFSFILS